MSDDSLNEILLERLKAFSVKPNENIDGIRTTAARLHSRICSQDKNIRERTLERVWRKTDGIIPLILSLLETVRDHVACCSLAGILHECVSPRTVKHRNPAVSQLLALNGTHVIIKLLTIHHSKETQMADVLLHELVWIMAQLAKRDHKFSMKVRLLGAARTFHNLLRTHYNNVKFLYPLLLLTKSLARNVNTTSVLVKDGIVATMTKVLASVGHSPNPKLRLCLNILHYISKNKVCCTRMAKDDMVPLILRIFDRWERYTGKIRLRILTYTVITLKHISNTRVGRKTIKNSNGVHLLYKFCLLCPNERTYDSLLPRVAAIINSCLDKKIIPVEGPPPTVFSLPDVRTETSEGSEHTTGSGPRMSSSQETTPTTDDGSVTDSFFGNDDEDDDDDDDDDGSVKSHGSDHSITSAPVLREIEDLKQYTPIFQEMNSTDVTVLQSANDHKCTPRAKSFQEIAPRCFTFSPEDSSFSQPQGEEKKQSAYIFCCKDNNRTPVHTPMTSSLSENSFWHREVERRLTNYLHNVNSHTGVLVSSNNSKIDSKCSCYDLSRREVISTRAFSEPFMTSNNQNSVHMISGLKILADIPKHASLHYAYCVIASKVNSVHPIVKVAYPDMVGGEGAGQLEPLNVKDRKVCRAKLLSSLERAVHPNLLLDKVVYDLDELKEDPTSKNFSSENRHLYNLDERRVGQKDGSRFHLMFESRFESGNLRRAIQVGPHEYDLILMPDVNSIRHHQWFYFEVSNMEENVSYTFNITNCEKQNSQFNYGMKPILYSVKEAMLGRPGWVRIGTDICYYRNNYHNPHGRSRSWFLSTSFTVIFPHSLDVCYIAYHFPYPYSQLLTQIWKWALLVDPSYIYYRADSLCCTLNNNETPVLTITSPNMEDNRIQDREVVFLTARVHPGESNASWVMNGTIHYLLSDAPAAIMIRNKFVFKIVPMLNIEGVVNGCHRCGLSDEDLNRRWSKPNQFLHPIIYHSKGLLEFCSRVLNKTPFMFCDYHGHSRRKNVFFYGCCNAGSWNDVDRATPDDPVDYLMLPHLMQHFSRAFNLAACNFRVERVREATARVTVWREFGVKRSYTMESSFCGCDQGYYQGYHLDTIHLKEIGANFCEAMACLKDEGLWRTDLSVTPEEAARLVSQFIPPLSSQNKHHSTTKKPSTRGIHPVSEDSQA